MPAAAGRLCVLWVRVGHCGKFALSRIHPDLRTFKYALACELPQSNQLQPLHARMAVLADDDVVVHGNAERGGDVDDGFGHLDIRLRRCRIAGGDGCAPDRGVQLLR